MRNGEMGNGEVEWTVAQCDILLNCATNSLTELN